MRSASPEEPSATDLTAKARIRDTAMACFGRDGFTASIRTIAACAGVSPGLVIHHFGSKDALRKACDERFWQIVTQSKNAILGGNDQGMGLLSELARLDEYDDLFAYFIRSLQDGGEAARQFIESYMGKAEAMVEGMVAAGTVRPSRDPTARARYMVMEAVGLVLAYAILCPQRVQSADGIRNLIDDVTLPMFELYTEGFFTDSALLDAYTASRGIAPPTGEIPSSEPEKGNQS
jgi:AcrR family transcriptional regulator